MALTTSSGPKLVPEGGEELESGKVSGTIDEVGWGGVGMGMGTLRAGRRAGCERQSVECSRHYEVALAEVVVWPPLPGWYYDNQNSLDIFLHRLYRELSTPFSYLGRRGR